MKLDIVYIIMVFFLKCWSMVHVYIYPLVFVIAKMCFKVHPLCHCVLVAVVVVCVNISACIP